MKTGVSTACLYPMLLENSFESLAMRGVGNIEVFVNTHCELSINFINLLKDIKDRYGANVVSMHPFTSAIEPMIFTPYPRRLIDTIDYYKKYFEAMNILGGNVLVFHGNKPQNPFPKEQYFENFAKLHEVGKEFGITVAQENVARCVSAKLDFLKDMSDYLGDEVSFNIDVKQAIRSGEDPFEMIDALKGKISNIHFSDNSPQADCMLFGEGTFACREFLEKLHRDGYDEAIVIEVYNNFEGGADRLAENYNQLKTLVDSITEKGLRD